ncbi:hypothetical protein [Streptomyces zaomyceticus]|uniref:hypothetical protein n=1 Tax=Streptomyces zaomyceticus TaxID=68286 RepID=UPI002E0FAA05|nr:hypothetical protein OG237_15675 [Streptomyces zaomyceticus]
MKHAELLAAARRVLWQTWMNAAEEIGASGAQGLLDAGMLVEPGGAAELERLRLLLGAQPVELTEEQLSALVEAGNGAMSDYYHERACACSEYPAGCATNPTYRREFGYWDTDAFAVGMGAVLGVWESIRADAATAELAVLRARVAELELLAPAPIQTCRTCGAGYDLGQPCSTCRFRSLMSEAQEQAEQPRPRGASEIKHPVMRPTREHLAKNPMPEQKKKGAA